MRVALQRWYTLKMIRKSLPIILLLLVLAPALTGWAGDTCCSADASRCGTSCPEGNTPNPDPGADNHADPGHQQGACGCDCHALWMNHHPLSPGSAPRLGTLDLQDSEDPSNAHLSEIFRPPLA